MSEDLTRKSLGADEIAHLREVLQIVAAKADLLIAEAESPMLSTAARIIVANVEQALALLEE